MLIGFFNILRNAGVPVSLRELLDLLGALQADLAFADMDGFYYLGRSVMVKELVAHHTVIPRPMVAGVLGMLRTIL